MRTSLSLIALALGSLVALPCAAANIDLSFTGYATVGANFIDFNSSANGSGSAVTPPGYGAFTVTGVPNASVFPGIAAGDTGFVESLMAGLTGFTQPFIKFNTAGTGVVLNLTTVPTQVGSGSCIAAGVPAIFLLCDTATGATAAFSVDGTVSSGQNYTGVFQATFAGTSVATLLSDEASGMAISTPFSATITTTAIPEPASLALLGVGLLGVGAFARKKFTRS